MHVKARSKVKFALSNELHSIDLAYHTSSFLPKIVCPPRTLRNAQMSSFLAL